MSKENVSIKYIINNLYNKLSFFNFLYVFVLNKNTINTNLRFNKKKKEKLIYMAHCKTNM